MRLNRKSVFKTSDLCQGILKNQKKVIKVLAEFNFCINFALALLNKSNLWPVRLSARTPGFHPGKRGSIPLRATSYKDN